MKNIFNNQNNYLNYIDNIKVKDELIEERKDEYNGKTI